MQNKKEQLNGAFHLRQSCLSYGQFIVLDSKVFMDSISSEQLASVVEETNQSLLVLFTRCSSGCDGEGMLIPEKVMLWEVEQNDNTTSLLRLAGQNLSQLTSSLQTLKLGSRSSESGPSDLLGQVFAVSPIIKWLMYPISTLLDVDDKAHFAEYMVMRNKNQEGYPGWFLHIWDVFHLSDMLLVYFLDKLEQFRKK